MKKVFLLLAIFSAIAVFAAKAETVKSVTQISYDAAGRQTCVATRMNESTFFNLPVNACTHSAAGSQGADRITKTVYDAAGQVRQVIQAYGTPIQRAYSTLAYSANGKVTDSIDANGNRTRMEYDPFERLNKIYYPASTAPASYSPSTPDTAMATAGGWNPDDFEQFQYDNNDNKIFFRRRNGYVFNYTYDNLNQLSIENVPVSPGNTNGVDKDIYYSYRYDGLLLKKRFAGFNGTGITYSYDGIGRMTSTTDSFGRQLISGYTVTGAPRTQLFYPDSKVWTQSYDATGLPISIADSQSQIVFGLSYNNFGQRKSLLRTSGPTTSYDYDGLKRLSSLSHDLNGTQDDITYGFTYNPARQIASISTSTNLYDYKETSNTIENRTYDGLNRDATIAANGGYDVNGNLTKDATRLMVYDAYNRLISVATLSNPTPYMTLTYDTEGRLLQTVINSVTTSFLYDGAKLVAEYNGAGSISRRYLHGPGTDEPIVWYEGSGILDRRYFIQNYQRSVIATTDGAGNRLTLYKYGPYGEPKDGNNAENWSGSRFRYTGQIALAEAKLYYYKARVYDPKSGRFLQTDPIGYEDQMNLYAYVRNDPVNAVDPTGMATSLLANTYRIGKRVHKYESIGGAVRGVGRDIAYDWNQLGSGSTATAGQQLGSAADLILGTSFNEKHDGTPIPVDGTGKIHGDLPDVNDIDGELLEDWDDNLSESLQTRRDENERFPRGNPNGDDKDKRDFQKSQQHRERITAEQILLEKIRRRMTGL